MVETLKLAVAPVIGSLAFVLFGPTWASLFRIAWRGPRPLVRQRPRPCCCSARLGGCTTARAWPQLTCRGVLSLPVCAPGLHSPEQAHVLLALHPQEPSTTGEVSLVQLTNVELILHVEAVKLEVSLAFLSAPIP